MRFILPIFIFSINFSWAGFCPEESYEVNFKSSFSQTTEKYCLTKIDGKEVKHGPEIIKLSNGTIKSKKYYHQGKIVDSMPTSKIIQETKIRTPETTINPLQKITKSELINDIDDSGTYNNETYGFSIIKLKNWNYPSKSQQAQLIRQSGNPDETKTNMHANIDNILVTVTSKTSYPKTKKKFIMPRFFITAKFKLDSYGPKAADICEKLRNEMYLGRGYTSKTCNIKKIGNQEGYFMTGMTRYPFHMRETGKKKYVNTDLLIWVTIHKNQSLVFSYSGEGKENMSDFEKILASAKFY